MEKGIFTISLDFELIWGTADLFGVEKFREDCLIERNIVIERLLDVFGKYDISATWCIVGHLFLDQCQSNNGKKHPEIVRPNHIWQKEDWFVYDPVCNEDEEPLFYGRSLVEKIRNFPVRQEIGSHSFSHIIYGDDGCSKQVAESDIRACLDSAQSLGIELKSFAFPRDQVGHLDVLHKYGFDTYRGKIPVWYEQGERTIIKRLAHLWDVLSLTTPPVVNPYQTKEGLWNVPGSMIYFPMHGLRKYIPVLHRVKRATKGLDLAVDKKQIFHLWFHPTNMSSDVERMFEGLNLILEYAAELRQKDKLSILTMDEITKIASEKNI